MSGMLVDVNSSILFLLLVIGAHCLCFPTLTYKCSWTGYSRICSWLGRVLLDCAAGPISNEVQQASSVELWRHRELIWPSRLKLCVPAYV